jgi:hypothetical protein
VEELRLYSRTGTTHGTTVLVRSTTVRVLEYSIGRPSSCTVVPYVQLYSRSAEARGSRQALLIFVRSDLSDLSD